MNIKKVNAGVWVKVENELPEKERYYFTKSEKGAGGYTYFNNDRKGFDRIKECFFDDNIVFEWLKPVEGSVLSLEELEKSNTDFAEWIYKNQYTKYWGNEGENCDKWYKQYSPPDRKYYTTAELYKQSINQQIMNTQTEEAAEKVKRYILSTGNEINENTIAHAIIFSKKFDDLTGKDANEINKLLLSSTSKLKNKTTQK